MNDTTPLIESKMHEMLRKKTSGERLLMGCSMYDLSKELVRNSIQRATPNISSSKLRQEIFLRFYGNDFDSEHLEAILRHLRKVKEKRIK